MQDILLIKLHEYIHHNHPDLLVTLQQEGQLSTYLQEKVSSVNYLLEQFLIEGKPGYIIEERFMDELTKDLRPSKFNYLTSILEEEFESHYNRFKENGILTYEVINLIEVCKPEFEALGFTVDNENDKLLRFAITGALKEYLETNQ